MLNKFGITDGIGLHKTRGLLPIARLSELQRMPFSLGSCPWFAKIGRKLSRALCLSLHPVDREMANESGITVAIRLIRQCGNCPTLA
jgi:hypothetical protein